MQYPIADRPISAGAQRSAFPLTHLVPVCLAVLLECLAMGLLLPARIYAELGLDGALSFLAAMVLGRRALGPRALAPRVLGPRALRSVS